MISQSVAVHMSICQTVLFTITTMLNLYSLIGIDSLQYFVCSPVSFNCIVDEGLYVDTYGKITKNVVLQWGEPPTSVGL